MLEKLLVVFQEQAAGGEAIDRDRLLRHVGALSGDAIEQLLEAEKEAPGQLEAIHRPLFEDLAAVGKKGVGSTHQMAHELVRAVEDEERKVRLVLDHIGAASPDRAIKMLTGYIKTGPAKPFSDYIKRLYPDIFAKAQQNYDKLVDLSCLEPALTKLSAWVDEDRPEELILELRQLANEHKDIALLQKVALEQGSDEQRLVAAALSGVRQDREDLPAIFNLISEHKRHAPFAMLIAADLNPSAAAHIFALFLAEAVLQNPEEPEAEMTVSRARMLCAARFMLPHLGAPIAPMRDEQLAFLDREKEQQELKSLDKKYERWVAAVRAP